MRSPVLSIVVPAFNEEDAIAGCIAKWRSHLESRTLSWEIVVADDGSRDATAAVVEQAAASDARVRLVRCVHRGKGAAVRSGMLAARGAWRFLSDADVSMPPDNIGRFFAAVRECPSPLHVAVGSREAPGARRVGEPWRRHVIGRAFNIVVQAIVLPGIRDTQCGFKLLSTHAVDALLPHTRLDGFAFDVELLFLARMSGLRVQEVGIEWHARGESRVGLWRGATAFADVLRVRCNAWSGVYAHVRPIATEGPLGSLDDVSC